MRQRKKYKKCCIEKDQEHLQNSSSVPGLTVEELRGQKEHFLTREELQEMHSYELARLDPVKVAAPLRPLLVNQLHLFDECEPVVELFEKLGVPEELEGHLEDAIDNVARLGRKDLLLRLLKLRKGPTEALGLAARLLLVEDAPNPALALIDAEVLESLKTDKDCSIADLAHALMDGRHAALGILLARSVLPTTHYFNADVLLESLMEARDRLNLSPDEPFQRIIDEGFQESLDQHRDNRELQGARVRVEAKDRELAQLKARLTQLHSDLDRKEKEIKRAAETKLPSAPLPPVVKDDELLNDLRQRMGSLKQELKERHNERNELRRELRNALSDLEAMRQRSQPPAKSADDVLETTEESLLSDDDEPTPSGQPIRVPEFSKKFVESLASLPQTTVRHAFALIGRLVGGDEHAFVGVKRLKANREIYRQRVGADHRLLFRCHPASLEVLALINRRDLERKIKSLS